VPEIQWRHWFMASHYSNLIFRVQKKFGNFLNIDTAYWWAQAVRNHFKQIDQHV